jgi:uncharacterized repeat protein (TIGR01451 family)
MRIRLLVGAVLSVFLGLIAPGIAFADTGADLSVSVTGPTTLEQYSGGQTPTSYGGGNYRVTYTNAGPQVATNVVLNVWIGAGVSWDLFDTNMD